MNRSRVGRMFLLVIVLGWVGSAWAEQDFRQMDIFVAGENGVHTYRIPALISTSKGTLLAFSEARKQSSGDQTPTDLVLKRSFDHGTTWQPTQIVVKGIGREAIMNPTPVVDGRDGTIVLLCNRVPSVHVQYKPGAIRVLVLKSTDDGKTWSPPLDITEQVSDPKSWASLGVGPGGGLQISGGRLLIPFWHFEAGLEGDNVTNVIYSDDQGQSWKGTEWVPGYGNESQLVELSDGALMFNIRATSGGDCQTHHRRKVALSSDGGMTWSQVYLDQALITPCCQGSLVRFSRTTDDYAKNRLLFSNPAHTSKRVNLTVRLSYDEGKSWPISRTVYPGPSAYSSLSLLSDDRVAVLYERGQAHPYEKISLALFNLEWLSNGKDQLRRATK